MAKSYLNDAIIGNSRMLGCISSEGELLRLFWPNIDHMQQVDQFEVGFRLDNDNSVFLGNNNFNIEQRYENKTNILITQFTHEQTSIKIIQSDFCLMEQDIMLRRYTIKNLSNEDRNLRWLLYSSSTTSKENFTGSLIDLEREALIHYQRNQYMSISSDLAIESFQLGGDPKASIQSGMLDNAESVLMVRDGALTWNLGLLKTGEEAEITIQISFAAGYKEIKKLVSKARNLNSKNMQEETKQFWIKYLTSCNEAKSANQEYNDLYERSLLVFRLMYDSSKGGLMAAPEMDEEMQMCGRYAYCWGRDAAFIADALDQCGLHKEVEQFYQFAADTQEEDGSWFQRYSMDGNLAPAWGLQIDETGALIYGIWKHYCRTENLDFLKKTWDNVKMGADFLVAFQDEETGLPKHSRDLWEERWGVHTYSSASVHAGLVSAVQIAACLGEEISNKELWESAARRMKESIDTRLWEEDRQCFSRGIRTQLYPTEKMANKECMMVAVNNKGGMKKVVCRDSVVDISLIGLSIPFGVIDARNPRMTATANRIEELLTCKGVGGIRRYEEDEYIGGNPWILTTLWLALYYIEANEYEKALSYFNWAVKGRTSLDLLPEQVSKETGKPVWILPLTWSHAMYTLTYHSLLNKKLI
ncbi:MAG: glycoside hydrolase family 15 protein [Mobilitalea sp.]